MQLTKANRLIFLMSLLFTLVTPIPAFAIPRSNTETLQTRQIKVKSVEVVKGANDSKVSVIESNNGLTFDLGPDLSAPKVGDRIRITYIPKTRQITTWRFLTAEEKQGAEVLSAKELPVSDMLDRCLVCIVVVFTVLTLWSLVREILI